MQILSFGIVQTTSTVSCVALLFSLFFFFSFDCFLTNNSAEKENQDKKKSR